METVLARTFHPTMKQPPLIKTPNPTHPTSPSPLLRARAFRPTEKTKISRLCDRTFLHYSRTTTPLRSFKTRRRWFSLTAPFWLHRAGLLKNLLLTSIAPAVWHARESNPIGLRLFKLQGSARRGRLVKSTSEVRLL